MTWIISKALMEDYENSRSLRVPGAASSEESFLGGEPSAQSKSSLTPQVFLSPGKTTIASRLSRYGMTSEPLTEGRGEELLTWFQGAFRAKTSAPSGGAMDSMESVLDYGKKCGGSLAKLDPATCSLKTHQHSLFGGGLESLENLPRWGILADGELWALDTPGHLTVGSACGSLPTPLASDRKKAKLRKGYAEKPLTKGTPDSLPQYIARQVGTEHVQMEADLWDWMMGWPIGWSDLKPLETDKFQRWLDSHGKH